MNPIVKIGLGVAIAIIFPLLVGLGVEAFYQSPKNPYEKCISVLPEQTGSEKNFQDPMQDPTYRACYDAQQKIVDLHNRNVFVITTVIGFIALAAGALLYFESIAPVMPALVFGGLITIFYGAVRGFEAVDKRLLFVELLVLLAGIVGVTWRYLRMNKGQK